VENYEEFVKNYPLSPHASECHYNLAEIMFSLGNYQRAAEEYIEVSMRYPGSKYKETAAWNAIVASQNLLKKENGTMR
jgi:TolA-binding protein